IVEKNGSMIRPVAGRGASEYLQSLHDRERERQKAEKSYIPDTGGETLAGTSPWMDRTRWPITYKGVRRDILRRLTEMPPVSSPADHFLGQGSNPMDQDIISSQEDEVKISLLMILVDRMLDRCEETARHTGRSLLCWLRSTKPLTCYPKPFTLVGLKVSENKYRRYFKRFLALAFRAYRMPIDVRHRLTGIRFKKK
ncbi:hypothetical protein DL95DRAFT_247965, partial [Leptodontidium sp. 2 PMI_412]